MKFGDNLYSICKDLAVLFLQKEIKLYFGTVHRVGFKVSQLGCDD